MLRLFGWLYGCVADLRNTLYDKGVFESHELGARTISIGNITAGGTGKTPLVAYVAEILADGGEKVCVLTRGYGRENPRRRVLVSDGEGVLVDAKTGGDEPVELAYKLLGRAIVVADADRAATAKWAKGEFGITAFVLDDAFQHRRVKRDLDIVCIDATNPFGNGKVLPAGNLREPLANLSRADVVVITRANLVEDILNLKSEIKDYAPESEIFTASNKVARLLSLEEFHSKKQRQEKLKAPKSKIPDYPEHLSVSSVHSVVKSFEEERTTENTENTDQTQNSKALTFCALGNPTNFFAQVSLEGFDLVAKKPFPDHHYYSQEDVRKLEKMARSSGAELLLTTAKDAVKLSEIKFEMPCFVVETELILNDADAFVRLITASS